MKPAAPIEAVSHFIFGANQSEEMNLSKKRFPNYCPRKAYPSVDFLMDFGGRMRGLTSPKGCAAL